jgi:pimeloyl-ACP methyl ester carboxylesterase
VVKELGTETKVIAPDLPGFGRTSVLPGDPSIDRFARYIVEMLDREKIPQAVVAGMSMGGYVALAFAELYTERLAGLGLIATQAVADTEEARQARRAMIERVRKEGPGVAAMAAVPKLFADANAQKTELIKYPTEGAANAGADGIAWALEAMARRPDRTFLLREIDCPATVLHGSEDKFIPAARAAAMAQQISNCNFQEIPGAGHALPVEAPKEVATALLDLLKRAEPFQPQAHAKNRPPVTFAPSETGRL